jgi:hypothetical protein
VAIAGLLLSAMVASAATAQTAATYAGSATGYALKLTLADQGLTAGSSAAKLASDGTGEATGAGVLTAANTTATAKVGETKPEVCADTALDALEAAVMNLVQFGLACGSASASTTAATANGKIATADVNLAGPLQALPVQTSQITQPVSDGLSQLCAAIPAPLQSTVCAGTATVQTVLQSVTTTKALSAEVGSSTSGVTVSGATVTTESTASGAIIRIVPVPTLNGTTLPEALATITVSRANAKVVCDTSTGGNAVPTFDPAIVRVKLSGPLASLLDALTPVTSAVPQVPALPLGQIPANPIIGGTSEPKIVYDNGELSVTPGTSVTLFPGLPIETEIVVGNGTAKVNPDGTATATADGVKIHALKNIGTAVAPLTGGLLANLTHAEVAGGCVAATSAVAPPAPAAPIVTRELPRTGGSPENVPWLPIAGAAGLALAVVTRRALRTR